VALSLSFKIPAFFITGTKSRQKFAYYRSNGPENEHLKLFIRLKVWLR
jgi:hypothetical protein